MTTYSKSLLCLLAIIFMPTEYTFAQVGINSDNSDPDLSAMLDISSPDKGILIPRMDSTNRKAISNPATGLMVYDSTTNSFWYYANATWNNLNRTFLADADGDTKIQMEENSDDDIIRFDLGGTEFMRLDSGRIEILNTGGSVFIGEGAGANDDLSDNRNVFTGYKSGYNNTEGINNIFTGYQSGYNNVTGIYNVFLGSNTGLSNTDGSNNIFIGTNTGFSNTEGVNSIFSGNQAGYYNTTGNLNIFLGYQTGFKNTTGSRNLFLGNQAGYSNTAGGSNVFLGNKAGYYETGDSKLYIDNSNTTTPLIYGDFDSDSLQINGTLNINGVYEFPTVDGTGSQVLTTDGNGIVSWSTMTLDNLTDADGDTKIQVEESGNEDIIRFDLAGTEFMRLDSGRIEILNTGGSVFIGEEAGESENLLERGNVYIGHQSGKNSIEGEDNVFVGYQTGLNNTLGEDNVFVGYQSGLNNTEGEDNVFIGLLSGSKNTTGINNTYIGSFAGWNNTTGLNNLYLGTSTGFNSTTGFQNTYLGSGAGYNNQTGIQNIFIGYRAGYYETGSNKLYIDNSDTTSPLIYGEFNNNLFQINGKLNIKGLYQFPTTDGAANQVLATDGSGTVSWTDQGSIDLTGNIAIGTSSAGSESDFQDGSDATNDGFLTTPWIYTNAIEATGERSTGSTAITVGDDGKFGNGDEIHLVTNGISALTVDGNSCVGIGTTTPSNGLLEVSGAANAVSEYTYYNYNNSGSGGITINNPSYSIYANGKIAGTNFHAHSDKRIKQIQGVSNAKEDLKTLMNIEITNYRLIDKIAHGDVPVKKVIAQQVKEVYPQAITSNTTEIVPDIYQTANIDENGWIVFSNSEFHTSNTKLKVGEKVQILVKNKKEVVEVLEIKANTFRVSVEPLNFNDCTDNCIIFVYGRQVDDFHTVDYEAISMLNVSATQQLVKEIEQLTIKNKEQQKEINQLEAQVSKIQQLEQEVNKINALEVKLETFLQNQP